MRKLRLISAFVVALSLMTWLPGAVLALIGAETLLTMDTRDQLDPAISGNIVAYTDDRNLDTDIYYYNIGTAEEIQVTSGGGDQMLADVDGNWIVYTDFRSPDTPLNFLGK